MTDDAADDARGDDPLEPQPIEPSAPEEFGLVQVWWGDGKGKTTAALGMGLRAAGHGYRVHLLQFMKGGTSTVEDVRGEYNAIAATPGYSYENSGHYGWHRFHDGTDDDEHAARARGGLERARELVAARPPLVGQHRGPGTAVQQLGERIQMGTDPRVVRQVTPLEGAVDVDPNPEGGPSGVEVRQRP